MGRILYAIALAFFALEHVIYALGLPGPHLGPPWVLGGTLWALVVAVVLLVAAGAIATGRKMRLVGMALALVFLVEAALYVPPLLANLRDPKNWTPLSELLSLAGAAMFLAGLTLGRVVYGLPLIIVGVLHFIYAGFIATLIPSWIPAPLFWAYFVGVAFFAAAASLATGIMARLAGTLLGVMFGSWVLIVHLPRVLHALGNGNEWTSMFIALAMSGGAFLVSRRD